LLGTSTSSSTLLAVHPTQAYATPFTEVAGGRVECLAIDPLRSDLAYGTRLVQTTSGPRKALVKVRGVCFAHSFPGAHAD
jgi:hypothetical protein